MKRTRIPKDTKQRLKHLMEIINTFPDDYPEKEANEVVKMYGLIDRDYAEDIARGFRCPKFKASLKMLEGLWKKMGKPDFELLEFWDPILRDQLTYCVVTASRCEVDLDEILLSEDSEPQRTRSEKYSRESRIF